MSVGVEASFEPQARRRLVDGRQEQPQGGVVDVDGERSAWLAKLDVDVVSVDVVPVIRHLRLRTVGVHAIDQIDNGERVLDQNGVLVRVGREPAVKAETLLSCRCGDLVEAVQLERVCERRKQAL